MTAKPMLNSLHTIPQLLQFHHEHNSAQTVYAYATGRSDKLTEIKYLEFIRACHRAAHLVRPSRTGPDFEVVAIIALVDSIVYASTVVGLIQAGLIPFPISHRSTPTAVISLLKKTGSHRIMGTQFTLKELFQNVKMELTSSGVDSAYDVTFEEIPGLNDLFPKLGTESAHDSFLSYPSVSASSRHDIAVILHSSGSTGLPKPVKLSHNFIMRAWAMSATATQFSNHNLLVASMGLPPFHMLGIWIHVMLPLCHGISVAVYPPCVTSLQTVPIQPTPSSIIEHCHKTGSNAIITVPTLLQIWAQSDSSVDVLRSFKVTIFAGGPLASATGDYLVTKGVRLQSIYGGTEVGSPTVWTIEDSSENWAWQRFPSDSTHIRWEPQGDGTFELQLLNTETFCVAVEDLPDTHWYATSDLFSPHPTKPGLWSIVGRMDDVIVHSTGEKTVPGPWEDVVSMSPLISGVIMFGRERHQAGALLEPSPDNQVDIYDQDQVASFHNKIWPVIEEGNQLLPAFSKVVKEMVLIASQSKPLPRTGKGTVMRKAAYDQYKAEIDQIYDAVESIASGKPQSSYYATI